MKSDNLVACHECDLLLQRPPRRRPISCAALVEGGVAGASVDASAGGSGCATRSSDSASWNPAFEAGFNFAPGGHLGVDLRCTSRCRRR
ncbi:hypothetical protein [Burkholderia stagnalis]|uniref:hypothetical protein n=1 Tax=Burkholderia stagnalis TaxID=1503054 RepID=UPI000A459431|nr:hypothetical protein [Burkholderia stagnalis]